MPSKQAQLDEIRQKILDDKVCPELAEQATQLVFSDGNPEAEIVFVARSKDDNPKVKFAVEKVKARYVRNVFYTEEECAEAIINSLGGKATTFIGTSGNAVESRLAFEQGVLGNNGVYNSFSLGPEIKVKTMPFGFKNHLIFGVYLGLQD